MMACARREAGAEAHDPKIALPYEGVKEFEVSGVERTIAAHDGCEATAC
jgi:hypothetical protein